MPKRPDVTHVVVGMDTRYPFTMSVIDHVDNAATNGTALRTALALPTVQDRYPAEHISIVRLGPNVARTKRDLRRFCMKVGVTDEREIVAIILAFAEGFIEMLRRIEEESTANSNIPIPESKRGPPKK